MASGTQDVVTRRLRPSIAQKLAAVETYELLGLAGAILKTGYAKSNLTRWRREKQQMDDSELNKSKRKNTQSTRSQYVLPDEDEVVTFMKETCREEKLLTTSIIINFLRSSNLSWFDDYIATRDGGLDSMYRLVQRLTERHGFTQRICGQPRTQLEFQETRAEFAKYFSENYGQYPLECIYNADETGFYYDMLPESIWAEKGGSSNVLHHQKLSHRMTALLTARADGLKLPIVFVIRGMEGGMIEESEFKSYPKGHYYFMQQNGSGNGRVWQAYLREVLGQFIEEPSILMVDNFKCHVNSVSEEIVGTELGSELCALPSNSTSHCQPLDVGLIGPFKKKLRALGPIDYGQARSAREKRLDMILRSIEAWESIDSDIVAESFRKVLL